MLPVTKQNEFVTTATQTVRLGFQDTRNDAGPMPAVCRICLAMNLKMYNISQHKLGAMYEQVIGVKINTEEKLPQELCWECVARLSSANRFIEKAIKTHWILMTKNISGRCITERDIKSIDSVQIIHQLKSVLGTKHYEVNHSDFHIIKKTVEIDDIHEFNNEIIGDMVQNNCNVDAIEKESCEYKEEVDFSSTDEEEQIYVTIVGASNEEILSIHPIKNEQVDIDEEQVDIDEEHETSDNIQMITSIEADISDVKYENEDTDTSNDEFVINIKEENSSNDEIAVYNVNKSREVCKITDQRWKKRNSSPTPLGDRRSNTLSHCKELIVVLEDIMLSSKYRNRLTANAPSTEENENKCHVPIMNMNIMNKEENYIFKTSDSMTSKELADNKITRTINLSNKHHGNTQTISTRASNLDMNSSVKSNDTVYKLFICDICNKLFHHKSILIRHMLKHPKVYSCTYCDYKTNHKGDYDKHINSQHTKNTVFNCSDCSFKTYNKRNLNRHINSKHTKSVVFNCPYCSFKAYRKCHLNRHIKSKHNKNSF